MRDDSRKVYVDLATKRHEGREVRLVFEDPAKVLETE
jgi:hypothetical protein